MPGLELEDVIERGDKSTPAGEDVPVSPGNLDLEDVAIDEPAPEQSAQESAPAAGTGNSWLDTLLGAEEGLTLGNTKNLGKLGAGIATKVSDLVMPSLERDGMAPEYVGRRGAADVVSAPAEQAQETLAGKAGRMLGTGITAVGSGGLAGPSIAGQAAVGAGLGSAAAAGPSGGDPLSMLAGMAAGGAAGAAGGALAKGAASLAGPAMRGGIASTGTRAEQALEYLSKLGEAKTWVPGPIRDLSSKAALAGLHGASKLAPAVRAATPLVAGGLGSTVGALSPASAQEPAYGTPTTMSWAVQSVLSAGNTGLPPADEQRLTEAVVDGDVDRIISANFALQMRHPAYAKRMRDELESLQQEE